MPRLSFDDLDDSPLPDPRWTADKLARAGWSFRGERGCRTCGEPVEFYHQDTLKGPKWLILEHTLEPHRCSQ
jgi:hypothetical protein